MALFEASTAVENCSPESFDFIADVENLPRYFPLVSSVEWVSDDRIRVTVDGEASFLVDGEAWVDVDHDKQVLAWGAPGPMGWSGEVQLEDCTHEDDGYFLTVRLRTAAEDPGDVQRDVLRMLRSLKAQIEE